MTEPNNSSAFSDQTGDASPDPTEPATETPVGTETPTVTAPPATARAIPTATKQTYPIRGVLWGVLFGLGLMIVAIVTKMISLSLAPALIVLVLGIAAGTAWSLFGPAKPAKT